MAEAFLHCVITMHPSCLSGGFDWAIDPILRKESLHHLDGFLSIVVREKKTKVLLN